MSSDSYQLFLASWGLQELKNNQYPSDFYLIGLLACLRSEFDYILYEYNEMFKLGIGADDALNYRVFEKKAKEKGNEEAVRFFSFYQKHWKLLFQDETVSKLLGGNGLRNMLIHKRRTDKISESEIKMCEYCLDKVAEFFRMIVSQFPPAI